MDIIEAIKSRKSIRAYKSDPVPRDILRNILEIAGRAPSAMNTQPWEFTVISGNPLANIARDNAAKLSAGEMPNPEHHVVGWTQDSVHRQRQVELAVDEAVGGARFLLRGLWLQAQVPLQGRQLYQHLLGLVHR